MATQASRASTPTDELVMAITEAVAASSDVDPTSLPPLVETVDPEALTELVGGDGLWDVTFSYHDHVVTVDGDGHVRVSELSW